MYHFITLISNFLLIFFSDLIEMIWDKWRLFAIFALLLIESCQNCDVLTRFFAEIWGKQVPAGKGREINSTIIQKWKIKNSMDVFTNVDYRAFVPNVSNISSILARSSGLNISRIFWTFIKKIWSHSTKDFPVRTDKKCAKNMVNQEDHTKQVSESTESLIHYKFDIILTLIFR